VRCNEQHQADFCSEGLANSGFLRTISTVRQAIKPHLKPTINGFRTNCKLDVAVIPENKPLSSFDSQVLTGE
jgi:hypothetical protein